ncbi:hypothetical protein PoB_000021800 [Plakobranchus ocellatus]|uniref:Uncharacterized protein n=1 Tax=Plakobranchus ocellatus TaxID=259542 RepID=A0AAV3XT12_9GAST|nr:hypothetical protein PoB_000021800 [Plakobranchus ocellatus]
MVQPKPGGPVWRSVAHLVFNLRPDKPFDGFDAYVALHSVTGLVLKVAVGSQAKEYCSNGRITQVKDGDDYTSNGASPQQDDLSLSGPPSGQGAGSGARTRDRRIPADLRADSLAPVPPTPRWFGMIST